MDRTVWLQGRDSRVNFEKGTKTFEDQGDIKELFLDLFENGKVVFFGMNDDMVYVTSNMDSPVEISDLVLAALKFVAEKDAN